MVCKTKLRCEKCKRDITANNYTRHLLKCSGLKTKVKYPGKRGGWNKGLSKDNCQSLRERSLIRKQKIRNGEIVIKGTPHSEEFKREQSIRAKQRGLGGHSSSHRIAYVMKSGETVNLQSSYEVNFAKILDKLSIGWERPEPLIYMGLDNKLHRYYPDFKIGNIYIDTKNDYLAIKDLPKIELVRVQHSVDLRIVKLEDINEDYIAALV